MKRNIFTNGKKGQVGLTLSWLAAFIFIFFIMLFFLAASVAMASLRGIPVVSWLAGYERNEINLNENAPGDMALERNLIGFINSPAEFEGNFVTVGELASGRLFADKESGRAEKFNLLGGAFLRNNSAIAPGTYYSGMWIRLYSSDEEVSKSYSGKNKAFGAAYQGSCAPEDAKASTLKILVSEDKKVVLCVER